MNEWMNEWMKSYIADVSSRRLFRVLNIESNLAGPVIIQIPTQSPGRYAAELPIRRIKLFFIQSKFALCAKYSHIVDFPGVSPDGNCAYVHWGSFTSNSRSVRRAIYFTWFSETHDTTSPQACPSVYSTCWNHVVTHPIMDRARRCLTLVIESTPMS